MQLAYDEFIDIVDLNYIPSERIGYSSNSDIYEASEINKTLE